MIIFFFQLSTDHTISSNSELRRLDSLGLDIEKLQVSGLLTVTRSLGDWTLKGGYKNIAELRYYAKHQFVNIQLKTKKQIRKT